MKVLEIVAIRGKGGTGASVVSFTQTLVSMGVEVDVVCFRRSDVYKRLKDFSGVNVITGVKMPRNFKPVAFMKDLFALVRLMKIRKYDVVHTHSSPDSNIGLVLKILFPHIKLVRTRHVPVPFSEGFKQKFFDCIFARSFAIYETVKKTAFNKKIYVIYDGIDNIDNVTLRSKKTCKSLTIGCISRYAKVKGLPFFVMSVKELSKFWRFKAFVAGRTRRIEGDIRIKKLEEFSKKLKVYDIIHFNGFISDVSGLYSKMDISSLTSIDSEGSSRVTLESFNYKIPVVASKVGSLVELIESGKSGFLCDAADWRDFSSKFAFLFSLPKVRKRMGENAFKRAKIKFQLDINVRKMLEILCEDTSYSLS